MFCNHLRSSISIIVVIFAFIAQKARANDIPHDVQNGVLPIQKILEEARKKQAEHPDQILIGKKRASERADVGEFQHQNYLRTTRSYVMTPHGLRAISAIRGHGVLPLPADNDPQGNADANDGSDTTAFEEDGAPLTPGHLATFQACKDSRTELGIDTLNTYWMSVISSIAYLKFPIAFDRLKQMGFEDILFIEGASSTEVYVAKINPKKDANGNIIPDSGLTVVSFRGTDKPEDWLTNLNATTTDITGHENEAWVHDGFALALDEVYGEILKALDLKNNPSPIFLTGHSLGGALTMQLALRLVSKDSPTTPALISDTDHRLRGVYVFATPRVGNVWARVLLDQYMNRSRGVEVHLHTDEDPAPKVPFDWMGYKRFGVQAVLPYSSKDDVDYGNRSKWVCHDDIDYKGHSAFSWDLMHSSIDAHHMHSYIKHFLPWTTAVETMKCSDPNPTWGPRFEDENPAAFRVLRTAAQENINPCNHTPISWGGNIVQ